MSKEVIKLDENGIYETNSKRWIPLLGAELVSAFVQENVLRLYFRTKDGKVIRVKIGLDYWTYIRIEEIKR